METQTTINNNVVNFNEKIPAWKKYADKNKEKIALSKKIYYEKNKEKSSLQSKIRYAKKEKKIYMPELEIQLE